MSAGAPAAAPDMAACRTLLNEPMRVTLSDGRVIIGDFTCFDKQRNILLTNGRELRRASEDVAPVERHVGLVLIPWRFVDKCHAAAQAA